MFTRTYGVMYQKNAQVFQNYFKDLQVYYDKGVLNPVDSTNSFFNTLYQKMFQVLLSFIVQNLFFETLRFIGLLRRQQALTTKIFAGSKRSVQFRRALPVLRVGEHGHVAALRRRAAQARLVCQAVAGGGSGSRQGAEDRTRDRQPDDQGENLRGIHSSTSKANKQGLLLY